MVDGSRRSGLHTGRLQAHWCFSPETLGLEEGECLEMGAIISSLSSDKAVYRSEGQTSADPQTLSTLRRKRNRDLLPVRRRAVSPVSRCRTCVLDVDIESQGLHVPRLCPDSVVIKGGSVDVGLCRE